MTHILQVFRYVVTGVLIACNAIIASVAVWNLNTVQATELRFPAMKKIDSFLIFVGASSLITVFLVMFVELLAYDTVLSRVWFETARVSVNFVLELGAATVLTAVSHPQLCLNNNVPVIILDLLPSALCVSTKLLQAFAWICTLFLALYLLLLMQSVVIRRKEDQTIWHISMTRFRWVDVLHSSQNTGTTSAIQFQDVSQLKVPPIIAPVMPHIEAPMPHRALGDTGGIVSMWPRSELDYEFERYIPARGYALQLDVHPTVPAMATTRDPTSFYPQHIQSAAASSMTGAPLRRQHLQPLEHRDPPPLGDWPRLYPPVSNKDIRAVPSKQDKVLRVRDQERASRSRPAGPRKRVITEPVASKH